jgi:hypothetical protein
VRVVGVIAPASMLSNFNAVTLARIVTAPETIEQRNCGLSSTAVSTERSKDHERLRKDSMGVDSVEKQGERYTVHRI